MCQRFHFAVPLLVAVMVPAMTCSAAEGPTLAAAQADYAAGEYRVCLQKVATLLTGDAAKAGSAQRYDLFMLRGEALLKMNQAGLAADAFDSASRVVRTQEDLKRTAAARATALLVRASPGLKYTPAAGGAAIEIIPTESRAKAIEALSKDRLAILRPQVAEGIKSNTIDVLTGLLPAWTDAYALELTAHGTAAPESLALGKSVGQHARELLTAELTRLDEQVEHLAALATSPAESATANEALRPRGLSEKDMQDLKGAIGALEKVNSVALEGRRINVRLGGDPGAWDAILSRASDCEQRAKEALAAKASGGSLSK